MSQTPSPIRKLSIAWRVLLAGGLILAGCQPAMRPPALVTPVSQATASHEATTLWGQIIASYATQATSAQLLSYATVTLLDASNTVVATGLTDAAGAFSLNPFVSWTPTTNAVYVLDALKSFDRTNDRAGLRFRTLVSWDGSQWRSLSGSTASPSGGSGVQLSPQTTALACIQSLRTLAGSALLGTLNPTTGAFTDTAGLTSSELATVVSLVNQAIAANLDPVAYLGYSSSDGSYRLKLSGNPARVLFDLEDAVGQSMNSRTVTRGHDGGAAYAFSGSGAYYLSQISARGSAAGLMDSPMGVDVDRYGNLYVADHKNHRIDKFAPDGRFLWSLGSQGTGSGQFKNPTDVSVDANGNILVCDYGNNRLQKFDAFGNLIFGIGGGGKWTGSAPAGSTAVSFAPNAFQSPHFARFDAVGNFWVSDSLHHRVLKYDANGNFQRGLSGGTTWTTPYTPNSLGVLASANYVNTVTWGAAVTRNTDGIAGDGTYAYLHDGNATNGGFFKVRISDGAVIAGPVSIPYLNGSYGGSMAFVNGQLYYRGSGTGANKISVIDPATLNETGYLMQNGSGTITSANNDAHPWGTCAAGYATYGLTTDGRYLYIPEDTTTGSTFTIHVYDPYTSMAWVRDVVCAVPAGTMSLNHHAFYSNGDYLYVLREQSEGAYVYEFRLADGAYLGTDPYYDPLAANPTPACYDYVNQRVLVQDHGSGRFTVFSTALKGTDNGWFNTPTGLAIAPNSDLYVCDRVNNRIQKFDQNGKYLMQWGSQGAGNGQFDTPDGLALDPAGNVWISDGWTNHRVQKFDRQGNFLSAFGAFGAGTGQFNQPRGLALAPDGTLLVSEWSNHRVQRLQPSSTCLTSPSYGYFNAPKGTLSFWFKPTWSGTDNLSRVFFRLNGTGTYFGLHKMGSQLYFYVTDNTGDPTRALRVGLTPAETARLIKAGEWHHLAVTWDGASGQLRIFFNGTEYGGYSTNLGTPMAFGTGGILSIGSEPDTTLPVDSVLDDFRIFDYPKSADEILRDYRGLVQE